MHSLSTAFSELVHNFVEKGVAKRLVFSYTLRKSTISLIQARLCRRLFHADWLFSRSHTGGI